MDVEEFIARIRLGVTTGIFTVGYAVAQLSKYNWNTTRDVPEDKRVAFLSILERGEL